MDPRVRLRQWLGPGASAERLGLRLRCERILVRDAWLLPRRRAWLRVLARLSWETARLQIPARNEAREGFEHWTLQEFEGLADEQAAEGRRGVPASHSPDAEFYRSLGRLIGRTPDRSRAWCVRVNGLPTADRLDLLADRRSLAGGMLLHSGRGRLLDLGVMAGCGLGAQARARSVVD